MTLKSGNSVSCPCGSKTFFSTCCEPVLLDHSKALTAEILMRSRYTAFCNKDSSHLLRTWHESTRPKTLNLVDQPVSWLGLTIIDTDSGRQDDSAGIVQFASKYFENGEVYELSETSEFLNEDGLWYYLRGDSRITKIKQERNKPCACGSGLKFKRCCLKKNPTALF